MISPETAHYYSGGPEEYVDTAGARGQGRMVTFLASTPSSLQIRGRQQQQSMQDSSYNMKLLRERYNVAQMRAAEFSSTNKTMIPLKVHGMQASRVYAALSTLLYASMGVSKVAALERFVRKNAAQLPSSLFDMSEWDSVLQVARTCRNAEGSGGGGEFVSQERGVQEGSAIIMMDEGSFVTSNYGAYEDDMEARQQQQHDKQPQQNTVMMRDDNDKESIYLQQLEELRVKLENQTVRALEAQIKNDKLLLDERMTTKTLRAQAISQGETLEQTEAAWREKVQALTLQLETLSANAAASSSALVAPADSALSQVKVEDIVASSATSLLTLQSLEEAHKDLEAKNQELEELVARQAAQIKDMEARTSAYEVAQSTSSSALSASAATIASFRKEKDLAEATAEDLGLQIAQITAAATSSLEEKNVEIEKLRSSLAEAEGIFFNANLSLATTRSQLRTAEQQLFHQRQKNQGDGSVAAADPALQVLPRFAAEIVSEAAILSGIKLVSYAAPFEVAAGQAALENTLAHEALSSSLHMAMAQQTQLEQHNANLKERNDHLELDAQKFQQELDDARARETQLKFSLEVLLDEVKKLSVASHESEATLEKDFATSAAFSVSSLSPSLFVQPQPAVTQESGKGNNTETLVFLEPRLSAVLTEKKEEIIREAEDFVAIERELKQFQELAKALTEAKSSLETALLEASANTETLKAAKDEASNALHDATYQNKQLFEQIILLEAELAQFKLQLSAANEKAKALLVSQREVETNLARKQQEMDSFQLESSLSLTSARTEIDMLKLQVQALAKEQQQIEGEASSNFIAPEAVGSPALAQVQVLNEHIRLLSEQLKTSREQFESQASAKHELEKQLDQVLSKIEDAKQDAERATALLESTHKVVETDEKKHLEAVMAANAEADSLKQRVMDLAAEVKTLRIQEKAQNEQWSRDREALEAEKNATSERLDQIEKELCDAKSALLLSEAQISRQTPSTTAVDDAIAQRGNERQVESETKLLQLEQEAQILTQELTASRSNLRESEVARNQLDQELMAVHKDKKRLEKSLAESLNSLNGKSPRNSPRLNPAVVTNSRPSSATSVRSFTTSLHARSVVKIQALARGILGRRRVMGILLEKAHSQGVLSAACDTTQGQTGWYRSAVGHLFYFVLDKGEYVLLGGPFSQAMYDLAVEELLGAFGPNKNSKKQTLKVDRLGVHATRLQIETLLDDVQVQGLKLATLEAKLADQKRTATLAERGRKEIASKYQQLDKDSKERMEAEVSKRTRCEERVKKEKETSLRTREELEAVKQALSLLSRSQELEKTQEDATRNLISASAASDTSGGTTSSSLPASMIPKIMSVATDFDYIKKLVKAQVLIRTMLAKAKVRRRRFFNQAEKSGVLVAMPNTRQGESGWYASPEGGVFYFTRYANEWILTAGPVSQGDYEKMINESNKGGARTKKQQRKPSSTFNITPQTTEGGSRKKSGARSLSRTNEKFPLFPCPFPLAIEFEDVKGDLYISSVSGDLVIAVDVVKLLHKSQKVL